MKIVLVIYFYVDLVEVFKISSFLESISNLNVTLEVNQGKLMVYRLHLRQVLHL